MMVIARNLPSFFEPFITGVVVQDYWYESNFVFRKVPVPSRDPLSPLWQFVPGGKRDDQFWAYYQGWVNKNLPHTMLAEEKAILFQGILDSNLLDEFLEERKKRKKKDETSSVRHPEAQPRQLEEIPRAMWTIRRNENDLGF